MYLLMDSEKDAEVSNHSYEGMHPLSLSSTHQPTHYLNSPLLAGDAGNKGGDQEYEEDGGKDHDDADACAFMQVTRDHKIGLNFTLNS